MRPQEADELEAVKQQLRVFATDLRQITMAARQRAEEAESALGQLREAYLTMVRTLAMVCEMKDNHTKSHLDRTYQYAMMLTRRIEPELAENAAIGYGYLLHDIGKVGIPDRIINKPGPLDDDEWEIMCTHPVIGWQLVQPIKVLGDAVKIVRQHHERWDGRGYPEGLQGEHIYLPARIFAIIDAFDAITSERPYQRALPIHAALEEIERNAGTQFDPEVAAAFLELCEELDLVDAESLSIIR